MMGDNLNDYILNSNNNILDKRARKKIKKADSLLRKNRPSEAVTIIKGIIKEFPDNAYLYYFLGIARMKCFRFFLAERALEKADKLDPNNSENLRSLGWIKVLLGKLEQGFEWLERAKALAPKDPFVLYNFETANKMKKEANKYSQFDLKLLRKEKLDPKTQKEFRLLMLSDFFENKPLNRDEMEEIKEELELNGMGSKTLVYKDTIDNNMTEEGILKRREEIEKELRDLLKKSKSDFTLEDIKEVIYNEEGDREFSKIISVFDHGQGSDELNSIWELLNDAWNHFPHKCLAGLCPMEKILESKKK